MTDPGKQFSRYDNKDLVRWVSGTFQGLGVSAAAADTTGEVLVRTNLRGIDTHGVARVPAYVGKILEKEVNPTAVPRAEWKSGVLHVDGDNGLGQYVAMQAVDAAVERARSNAVVTCLIKRSGHMAALGQFVLAAAEQGMVALMCQDTPPLMALPGSSRPAIGNNPIAFAAPVAGRAPIVFDMATSVVARGHVLQAVRDQVAEIPTDWAIGPDGQPTTDPARALQGAMAAMSGHKGIGLAMMVQVLAGSFTGSEKVPGSTSSGGGAGAFLQIFNPDHLIGRGQFDRHMAQWLATYAHASGAASRYPGERAAASEAQRREHGVPLAPSVVRELNELRKTTQLPFDLTELTT